MDKLIRKVYRDIEDGGLLQKGDSVVLGVSGGADSVCLLYVLLALRPVLALTLTVVHVHHGLRGAEADGDRDYVASLCGRENIPLVCFQADIRAMAAARHMSEEEAGRNFRYECFERVRTDVGAHKIAVAHHMDDQAETVLMNLFRGSGLKGLGGIPAARGHIVRPLLHLSRAEIEAYLERKGIAWRTDATNLEAVYTRNRLRLDVLPYVTEHINGEAIAHIAETAALAADACRYMETEARKAGQTIACWNQGGHGEGCRLAVDGFRGLHRALQRELLRQVLERTAGQLKDIGAEHIESVRQLFDGNSGRRISLPYGLEAVRSYGSVQIRRRKTAPCGNEPGAETPCGNEAGAEMPCGDEAGAEALWGDGRKTEMPCGFSLGDGRKIRFSLLKAEKNPQIPKKMYTKWFDYDKIKNRLVLRYRRGGDYMMIAGGHKKALRRILMDDRVPQDDRDSMVLLADGSHILWIPETGRISEYYKITETTKLILAAEFRISGRTEGNE